MVCLQNWGIPFKFANFCQENDSPLDFGDGVPIGTFFSAGYVSIGH